MTKIIFILLISLFTAIAVYTEEINFNVDSVAFDKNLSVPEESIIIPPPEHHEFTRKLPHYLFAYIRFTKNEEAFVYLLIRNKGKNRDYYLVKFNINAAVNLGFLSAEEIANRSLSYSLINPRTAQKLFQFSAERIISAKYGFLVAEISESFPVHYLSVRTTETGKIFGYTVGNEVDSAGNVLNELGNSLDIFLDEKRRDDKTGLDSFLNDHMKPTHKQSEGSSQKGPNEKDKD